jgi:protein-tyrosine-phosphatase
VETLLFVCTGNVCRSPMGEALATRLLAERAINVTVTSAGLLGAGRPTTKEVRLVMRRRGLDLSDHRSRRLADALLGPPDLIVTMAREHARAVMELHPALFPRTFTLKDLVRRAQNENRRQEGESMEGYLRRLEQGRKPWDLAGGNANEDVPDPIGQSKRVYERCAAEIETLVSVLVDKVWPVRTTEDSLQL